MPDIAARWPAKPRMHLRLERQQRENMVDIAPHGARAAGPPRPHRRRDVIDDRYGWRLLADPSCDPMGQFRTVDDDEDIRSRRDDRFGDRADIAKDRRQMRDQPQTDERK